MRPRVIHDERQAHLLGSREAAQRRFRSIQRAVNAFCNEFVAGQHVYFLFHHVRLLVIKVEVIVLDYPRQFLSLSNVFQAEPTTGQVRMQHDGHDIDAFLGKRLEQN